MNKYIGVAKSRIKNGSATDASGLAGTANQRWLDVVAGGVYVPSRTFFEIQNLGLVNGRASGIMYVTYYAWFKGQRVDIGP